MKTWVECSIYSLGRLFLGGVRMKGTTTSWLVTGLGAVVSGLGATMRRSRLGAGVIGFGLAHVVLGLLDRLRPSVNK